MTDFVGAFVREELKITVKKKIMSSWDLFKTEENLPNFEVFS